jgi:hypothetical protein
MGKVVGPINFNKTYNQGRIESPCVRTILPIAPRGASRWAGAGTRFALTEQIASTVEVAKPLTRAVAAEGRS